MSSRRVVLLALLAFSLVATASAQGFRYGDLVYAISFYPNFEGTGGGDLFYVRNGEVTGPHATSTYYGHWGLLVDDVNRTPDGLMFDRSDELVVVDANGVEVRAHKAPFLIAHFVLDASGNAYVSGAIHDFSAMISRPHLAKLSPSGEILWTIPFPPGMSVNGSENVTLDLAGDQCTMWYSPHTAGVGRYDVCRKVALPPVVTSDVASRIRILPDGGALLTLESGIVRIDATGSVVKTWPYALDSRRATAISISPDRQSFWVAEGDYPSIYYQVDLATDEVLQEFEAAHPFSTTAFAVYGEWRAATPPRNVRRRGIGRR